MVHFGPTIHVNDRKLRIQNLMELTILQPKHIKYMGLIWQIIVQMATLRCPRNLLLILTKLKAVNRI